MFYKLFWQCFGFSYGAFMLAVNVAVAAFRDGAFTRQRVGEEERKELAIGKYLRA